jgi:membrane protein implicated in regulation of membrane protease activity
MSVWWDKLNALQQFFYFIAVPSTVILFLQSILTLVGFGLDGDGDFDGGMDADLDGDFDMNADLNMDGTSDFEALAGLADFKFVTFRGLIAFATMFGWVGAAFAGTSVHVFLVLLFALIAGLLSMLMIAALFYGISKLQSNGNLNYRLSIGSEAQVYIPIPAGKKGHGKVQLMLQERLVEIDAITEDQEPIPTGDAVRVIDMLNATTLIVERL